MGNVKGFKFTETKIRYSECIQKHSSNEFREWSCSSWFDPNFLYWKIISNLKVVI